MIQWCRSTWDRWRRGPALRLLAEQQKGAERAHTEQRERINELHRHLQVVQERLRLLSELLHSGLKARCRGGCGDLTFQWAAHLVEVDGRSMLVPVCAKCRRAHARAATALASAAKPPPTDEAPAEGAVEERAEA